MRLIWYSLTFAAAVSLLSSEARGWSCGRWNMPSTPAQYFGYGYGPGHHAPMLRMPCCQPYDGPRVAFTSDCPPAQCFPCSATGGGSKMYRELSGPTEGVPTPAPPLQMAPNQSRRMMPNSFLR